MGKKKTQKKQKKDVSVFKVAGSKVSKWKNKPKPVTTNLKKVLVPMRNETLAVDDALSDVREVMIRCKKQKVQKCEEQLKIASLQKSVNEVPDVEIELKDFDKL
ncbi:hypothetical protein LSH36_330g05039 [Paralvinella palmiformis]|uniref:Uncharacterized protein n=1 Tax=Paralvinella palmiformis TaxID=53620 RepID=A0AAD9N289_9ANNE|nr:hypothetical protein LSH36_330g05039 [Paralvinella palmiformis]